jgi:hypothetical protein
MAQDSITEITGQSWGSRLGDSLKGIVLGLILVCVAIGVLWWNEGRAVKRARALDEGIGQVISIAADPIEATNEGKLVHVTGHATTSEKLSDPTFGVRAQTIKMTRVVQMYQWREHKHSKTREKVGGGTETVTTYTYDRGWESIVISSSGFKKPQGHQNPGYMPYKPWHTQAREVTLGAFRLSPALISKINRSTPILLNGNSGVHLPTPNSRLNGNEIYVGAHSSRPQIGDVRIHFNAVYPTDVSIVSVQRAESFVPYVASNGSQIELLEYGSQSAQQMFQVAQDRNTHWTWIIRAGGFIFMFIGCRMLLGTLPILAAVIPALGHLVAAATGLLSFVFAASISLVTIATAWIFYRPLLGIVLLVGAAVGIAGLKWAKTAKTPPPAPPVPAKAISAPPPPPSP